MDGQCKGACTLAFKCNPVCLPCLLQPTMDEYVKNLCLTSGIAYVGVKWSTEDAEGFREVRRPAVCLTGPLLQTPLGQELLSACFCSPAAASALTISLTEPVHAPCLLQPLVPFSSTNQSSMNWLVWYLCGLGTFPELRVNHGFPVTGFRIALVRQRMRELLVFGARGYILRGHLGAAATCRILRQACFNTLPSLLF